MSLDFLKSVAPTVLSLLSGGATAGLAGLAVEAVGTALGISDATKEKVTEVLSSGTLSADQIMNLKVAEQNVKVKLAELGVKLEDIAQTNVTSRWTADMSSDSWLSKNVRPLALIWWTLALTGLIFLDGFIKEFTPDAAYIVLMGEIIKMIYTAYFVGRTVEKAIEMVQVRKAGETQ